MMPALLMMALASAAGDPAEDLARIVMTTCGAESVAIEQLGVELERLPAHDAFRWTGEPCGTRPRLRLELHRGEELVGRYTVWPRMRVQPSAERGSDVQLRVTRGSLTVTAPGRLLADASAGGVAKVANQATGTVLTGRLVNATTVEIR